MISTSKTTTFPEYITSPGVAYSFNTVDFTSKNGVLITKLNWSINQNLQCKDSICIRGIKPCNSILDIVDVNLNINFEIHSCCSNGNPYYSNCYPNWQCSNTCVISKKICISQLCGYIENIYIDFDERFCIDNTYRLSIKIDVPCETIERLRGVDYCGNVLYGSIPFNQINVSFDVELTN
jgi:hypothetical protein